MHDDGPRLEIDIISVAEAKKRLELLKPKLPELKTKIIEFQKLEKKFNIFLRKNPDPQAISQERYNLDLKEEELIRVQLEFAEFDCVIKDWKSGLIDFIGLRNNEKVWLCFKNGEDELKYYHDWNAGYIGRKLIDFD